MPFLTYLGRHEEARIIEALVIYLQAQECEDFRDAVKSLTDNGRNKEKIAFLNFCKDPRHIDGTYAESYWSERRNEMVVFDPVLREEVETNKWLLDQFNQINAEGTGPSAKRGSVS